MRYRTNPPLHPISELTTRAMYSQVKSFSSLTKALTPGYTNPPEQQALRWHLWFDGTQVVSMLCEGHGAKKSWQQGPAVTVQDFTTGDSLSEYAIGLLAGSHGRKAPGVGVIVHIADCGSMTPVKEPLDVLEKFSVAAALAVDDPKQIMLGDPGENVDHFRWRAFPVAGGKKNKIHLMRLALSDMEGVARLLELEYPISVSVRCAQTEAIATCQWLADGIDPDGALSGDRAIAILLYYKKATILVLYDEEGHPAVVRHLPHAEGKMARDLAAEFSGLIRQAPIGAKTVVVTIFDFGNGNEEINEVLNSKQVNVGNTHILLQTMPATEMVDLTKALDVNLGLSSQETIPPEFLTEYKNVIIDSKKGMGKKSAAILLTAAEDNYLDASLEMRVSKVTTGDMRLFLVARLLRFCAIAAALLILAFIGWQSYRVLTSTYWKTPEQEFSKSKTELLALETEQEEGQALDSLLQPNNELWQNMELVLALFPESKDLLLADVRFTQDDATNSMKWAITGYANELGLGLIRSLQDPKVLTTAFEKVAKANEAWVFMSGADRTRKIAVREERNTTYSPDSAANLSNQFPMRFSAEITYTGAEYKEPQQP